MPSMNRRQPSPKRFRCFWQFFSAFLFLIGSLIGLASGTDPSVGGVPTRVVYLAGAFACALGGLRACWMHCRVEGSVLTHVGFWSTRRVHALEVVPESRAQKIFFTTWGPVVRTIDKDEIGLGFLSGYSFMSDQPNRRVERICEELNVLLAH
jgi:hypothetical protein